MRLRCDIAAKKQFIKITPQQQDKSFTDDKNDCNILYGKIFNNPTKCLYLLMLSALTYANNRHDFFYRSKLMLLLNILVGTWNTYGLASALC